jgi:mycothiol synthase
MTDAPPEGFELRAASLDDAPAIADVINDVTLAEIGVPWTDPARVRDDLGSQGRDPDLVDSLLVDRSGEAVGYLQFSATPEPLEVSALVFVRRPFWGRGLSAWLLHLAEEGVRDKPGVETPALLRVSRFSDNEPAARLFRSLGYAYARTFWIMRIELDAAPPPPSIPAGIEIHPFDPARDDLAVHAALAEAFADHWGPSYPSLDEWRHLEIDGEGAAFDPGLWFVAWDGDDVVGVAACRARSSQAEDTASVSDLAVRRPWRRRGVGLALLLSAFGEFHRRGIPRAELGVDADNPTGATHLYERAGMHVAYGWDVWEKRVAPRPDRTRTTSSG